MWTVQFLYDMQNNYTSMQFDLGTVYLAILKGKSVLLLLRNEYWEYIMLNSYKNIYNQHYQDNLVEEYYV
jgi:hypothetical protein